MKIYPEILDGYVLLARQIRGSNLFAMKPHTFKVAIYCLLSANHKPARWFDGQKTINIERGQFVTSELRMVDYCHLSRQNVRTALKNLGRIDFLTRSVTRKLTSNPTSGYSVITISNYEHYQNPDNYINQRHIQEDNPEANRPLTNHQPTTNQSLTINNNVNNETMEECKPKEVVVASDSIRSRALYLANLYMGYISKSYKLPMVIDRMVDMINKGGVGTPVERELTDKKNNGGMAPWEISDKIVKICKATEPDRIRKEKCKKEEEKWCPVCNGTGVDENKPCPPVKHWNGTEEIKVWGGFENCPMCKGTKLRKEDV